MHIPTASLPACFTSFMEQEHKGRDNNVHVPTRSPYSAHTSPQTNLIKLVYVFLCCCNLIMSRKWDPPKSSLDKKVDGLSLDDVSDDTVATSARYVFEEGPQTEPLVPPIYHSSTYRLKSVDDYLEILEKGGYIYSRLNNFTSDNVQSVLNNLEKGEGTLVFNTGMASITTALFGFLKSGDHVVINNPCYSGVFDIAKNIFPKFNIEVTFVQAGCNVDEYRKHVKSNTRMLYGETPCNPSMAILDLAEFGKLGRSLDNVITLVDSTFAGPYLQSPIQHGIDICMQSCTKYLGGHSDLTAGSLTFRTKPLWQEAIRYQTTFGSSLTFEMEWTHYAKR